MIFLKPEEIDKKELFPGCVAKLIHSENMTVVHWTIEADGHIPEHSHPHEQVANIIEGEFEFTIDGKTKRLDPGCVAIIPADAVHSGKAITECFIIDIFYPVREDYK